MGSHPVNLAVRFLLELGALAGLGYWGWTQYDGVWRFVWAIGAVVVAAVVWGTFAVPDDPSRSGQAPVPVPGILRLLIELIIFGVSVWAIIASGQTEIGWILGILVIIHYLVSYDRIIWLMQQ